VTLTVTTNIAIAPTRSKPVIEVPKMNSSAKNPYRMTIYPNILIKPDESL